MPGVSLVHARHICWCGQRLRRGQRLRYTHRVMKRAFEEFADISKVLQLLTWHGIVPSLSVSSYFTRFASLPLLSEDCKARTVLGWPFRFHFLKPLLFTILCQALYIPSLLWCWHALFWPRNEIYNKSASPTSALETNYIPKFDEYCILKRDGYLHS